MSEVNNLFILGAGFDKAVCEKLPLNDELLPALITSPFSGANLLASIEKYKTRNIEKYLTRLDLDILSAQGEQQKELKELRSQVNNLLVSFFRKFRFKESFLNGRPWLRAFIAEVISKNDIIISLNYSCLLDGLLDFCEVWSPNGGYSKFVQNWLTKDSLKENREIKNIQLYKIHGSEHFVESKMMNDPSATNIAPLIEPSIFPKSAAHSYFGGGIPHVGQYVIAPSFIKIPHVQISYLVADAFKKASRAKNLIIIGCGLRPEDQVLWLLITNFLKTDYPSVENKNRKLVLIDPNAENISARLKSYYGNLIGGFFETGALKTVPQPLREAVPTIKNILS